MSGDPLIGGCHIPFGYDPAHGLPCWPPGWVHITQPQTFLPPSHEQRLSDEDIERIAKRVAQLLGAKTCNRGDGEACSKCPR